MNQEEQDRLMQNAKFAVRRDEDIVQCVDTSTDQVIRALMIEDLDEQCWFVLIRNTNHEANAYKDMTLALIVPKSDLKLGMDECDQDVITLATLDVIETAMTAKKGTTDRFCWAQMEIEFDRDTDSKGAYTLAMDSASQFACLLEELDDETIQFVLEEKPIGLAFLKMQEFTAMEMMTYSYPYFHKDIDPDFLESVRDKRIAEGRLPSDNEGDTTDPKPVLH